MKKDSRPYITIWNGEKKEPITEDTIDITFVKVSEEDGKTKYAPAPPFVVGTFNKELIQDLRYISSKHSLVPILSNPEEEGDS